MHPFKQTCGLSFHDEFMRHFDREMERLEGWQPEPFIPPEPVEYPDALRRAEGTVQKQEETTRELEDSLRELRRATEVYTATEATYLASLDAAMNAIREAECDTVVRHAVAMVKADLLWEGIRYSNVPFDWSAYAGAANASEFCPDDVCAGRAMVACAGVNLATMAHEPGATREHIHAEAVRLLMVAKATCKHEDPSLTDARLEREGFHGAPEHIRTMSSRRSVWLKIFWRIVYVLIHIVVQAQKLWWWLLDTTRPLHNFLWLLFEIVKPIGFFILVVAILIRLNVQF